MRLTVVGCSGSFPGADSPASCYLVQAPYDGRTYSLVLDLGNGALGALQRHIELRNVDAVALSHLHVDHCIDLTSFYVMRCFLPDGPLPRLPVVGPPGTAERIAQAYGRLDTTDLDKIFDFADWQVDRSAAYGPFRVSVARVAHPVETYAVRVEHEGRSLVYSADTGPSEALVGLARGADLLLCEASFLESAQGPANLHLTGRQAAEHGARAGVRRLMLTHIPPWHDKQQVLAEAMAARPALDGPIELALPGAAYDV